MFKPALFYVYCWMAIVCGALIKKAWFKHASSMCLLFLLSLPTKLICYDVIMCAVEIWQQERGRGRVSGCPPVTKKS